MIAPALAKRIEYLEQRVAALTATADQDALRADKVLFSERIGLIPDDWQADLLRSQAKNILINCSRQSGKSTTASTLGLHTVLYEPGTTTVVLAPSMRQSTELMRKVITGYRVLGKPVPSDAENRLSLELGNNARMLCLPGAEATVRGISGVDLLIVEEASRVPDDLYKSVRPMLATRPNARIVMMSTPYGTRGFFWETWKYLKYLAQQLGIKVTLTPFGMVVGQWAYYEIPAERCPRITPEFLAEEKRTLGQFWYDQEYGCQFLDAQSSAFKDADIERMKDSEVELWQLR